MPHSVPPATLKREASRLVSAYFGFRQVYEKIAYDRQTLRYMWPDWSVASGREATGRLSRSCRYCLSLRFSRRATALVASDRNDGLRLAVTCRLRGLIFRFPTHPRCTQTCQAAASMLHPLDCAPCTPDNVMNFAVARVAFRDAMHLAPSGIGRSLYRFVSISDGVPAKPHYRPCDLLWGRYRPRNRPPALSPCHALRLLLNYRRHAAFQGVYKSFCCRVGGGLCSGSSRMYMTFTNSDPSCVASLIRWLSPP